MGARIRAVRKIKKERARMVKTRTRRNQTLNDEDGYELSLVLISNNHAISPSSVCLPCPFIIHMTWTKFRGRKIRKNKCVILLISLNLELVKEKFYFGCLNERSTHM